GATVRRWADEPSFDRSHCGAGLDRKDAALGWTGRPDHRPRAGRLGRLGAIADELTFTANLCVVHSASPDYNGTRAPEAFLKNQLMSRRPSTPSRDLPAGAGQ